MHLHFLLRKLILHANTYNIFMAKVIVKGSFEDAMKRFKRVTQDTNKYAKRHSYYVRPGIRKMEKSKEALKTKALDRKIKLNRATRLAVETKK